MKMFSFFEKKYRHNYFNRKIRKALDIYFNKGNIKSLMEIFENNKNEDQLLALMNFFEACQDKYFRKFYTSSKAGFWHDYVQPFNFLYSIIKKISEKPDLFDSKLYDILKISSFDNQVFINQLALLFLGNIKNAKSLDIIIEIFLNRLLDQNINKHHFNNIINALSNINPKHCPSNVKNIIEHDFQTLIKNNNINKYNFTYIKYDNRALFSIFYDLIEYAIINRKNEILLIIFVSNFSDNEIEQFLIKLLHSERNEIRFLSAYLLYKYQNIEMVDELINLFRNDLIEIKTAAAYSLGSKKDKKIAEEFLKFLKSYDFTFLFDSIYKFQNDKDLNFKEKSKLKHSLIFEVNLLKEAITFLAKQKDKNGFDFLIFLIKKLHSYKYNMIPIDDLMLAAIQSLSHYDYSDNEYYAKLNDLRKYNPNSIAISEIISDAVANNSERLVSILNSQYSSIREVRLLMKLELKNHQILGQDTKNQDIILSKLFKFKIIRAISYRRKSLVEDRDWLTKKMNHEIEGSDEINSLIRSYFEDFGEIIINLITYFQISSWHPIVHDLDDGPPDRTTNVVDSKMEYSLKQLGKINNQISNDILILFIKYFDSPETPRPWHSIGIKKNIAKNILVERFVAQGMTQGAITDELNRLGINS